MKHLLFIAAILFFTLPIQAMEADKPEAATTLIAPPEQYYLSDPLFSDEELKTWLNDTITSIFDIGYEAHAEQLTESKSYFTKTGYKSFLAFIDQENIIKEITDKTLNVTAYCEAPFIIKAKKVVNHKYQWEIGTTITLFYQGPSQAFSQDLPLNITVTRATPNTGVGVLVEDIN